MPLSRRQLKSQIELLHATLKMNPRDTDLFVSLHQHLQAYQASREMYQASLAIVAHDQETLLKLLRQNNVLNFNADDLIYISERIEAFEHQNAWLWHSLGRCYLRLADSENAKHAFRQALTLGEDHIDILTSVANSYLDYATQFDDYDARAAALTLIEKAYLLEPDDLHAKRLYAWHADLSLVDLHQLCQELAEAFPTKTYLQLEYQWVAFYTEQHSERRLKEIAAEKPNLFDEITIETVEQLFDDYDNQIKGWQYKLRAWQLAAALRPDNPIYLYNISEAERALANLSAYERSSFNSSSRSYGLFVTNQQAGQDDVENPPTRLGINRV